MAPDDVFVCNSVSLTMYQKKKKKSTSGFFEISAPQAPVSFLSLSHTNQAQFNTSLLLKLETERLDIQGLLHFNSIGPPLQFNWFSLKKQREVTFN